MAGRAVFANCARTQSRQSVIPSIARRAGFVAVLITLVVFLFPTAAVHAQLSPRAQIIVDFLDLTKKNFKGTLVEEDGVLKIGGTKYTTVNNTVIATPIGMQINLRTAAFTYQPLGPAGNPNVSGSGMNLSRDGSCVVGYQDSGFSTPFHAFRWTETTGPVDLGTLDPPNNTSFSSFATDTNQDCSVVVGISNTTDTFTEHAFRWTPGGMIDLGVPANGGPVSRGMGTSADGTVVVGDADFPDPENLVSGKGRKAFRWTQAGGFQSLGQLQPAGISIATAVTGDGTTAVGQATTNSGSAAFRWTAQTPVMEPIGTLPGHAHAAATAVSDNGKIVIGISNPTFLQYQGPVLGWGQGTAFRWTQATGIRELRQVLIDSGVDMTGITLVTTTGISPDGQWIAGDATTSQTGPDQTVPFIAQMCDADIGGPCSAAGAAASLYFSHVDTSLPWQTEIAVINTSDQTVTGTLRGVSDTGQSIDTKPVTLSAHGRRQIVVADEFTNHTEIGYIIFDTDSTVVQGYTKFYQTGIYRAAIPAVRVVNTSDVYISHIDISAQWSTGISLVNTTSATKDLTITFNNGQSRQITLTANQHRAYDIAHDFFNSQPQLDVQSAVITNASGIIGLELFANVGGPSHMDGLLLTGNTTPTLYYPHVASDNVWWTGVVAYNPSASACTMTITPYNASGGALTPSILPLGVTEKFVRLVSDLALPAQTAWFKIDSTSPLTGFELFGTLDDNRLGAYAGGGATGATAGVFPKIEKNGGWTGIAFVNTEAGAASVTLIAYADNGTPVATSQVFSVGSHAKEVRLAEEFFAQSIANATYIAYTSDRNVVGFQLNGSLGDLMLDGLPSLGGTN